MTAPAAARPVRKKQRQELKVPRTSLLGGVKAPVMQNVLPEAPARNPKKSMKKIPDAAARRVPRVMTTRGRAKTAL